MRGRQVSKHVRQGVIIAGALLASLWLGTLIWGLAGKARVAITQEQDVKRQYDALEARRERLTANLADLATPRGQDAAIRQAFDVARPGEEVIVVVPPATTTATTTPSWWQRWFGWL